MRLHVLFAFCCCCVTLVSGWGGGKKKAAEAAATEAPSDVLVSCRGTFGLMRIMVTPRTAPLGAARFLALVKYGHFDGTPFHRAIEGYIAQFGISPRGWRMKDWPDIADDPFELTEEEPVFKRGWLSFAGYVERRWGCAGRRYYSQYCARCRTAAAVAAAAAAPCRYSLLRVRY